MSRPWMPLYVADYLRDTRKLTAAEHGGYLLLIMEYWTAGQLPDDDRQLARIASMSAAEWKRARPNIEGFFQPGWKHKRIDAELAKSAEISSKRSASAKQRHSNSSANAQQVDTHARASSQSQSQKEDEYCPVAKATRTKNSYSEEFEGKFWNPYPRTPTMSKAEAWKIWIKLTPEDRTSACEAIEPYKRFLKSKPNLETVHACRFLSQRRFEGFKEVPPAQVFDIRSHLV